MRTTASSEPPPKAGPSIVRRLAVRLALCVALLLSAVSVSVYVGVGYLHEQAQTKLLAIKVHKLIETSSAMLRPGSQDFLKLLQVNAAKRHGSRLVLYHADGNVFYRDPPGEAHDLSAQIRSRSFSLQSADGQMVLDGRFDVDVAEDDSRQQALAQLLVLVTAIGALCSGLLAFLVVRHGIEPLRKLAAQTQQMSATHRLAHLRLSQRSLEFSPLVDQFNVLIDRLEASRIQLEAFNSDVAHELRTPLTALIGKTELALSRPRSMEEITQTLASNLEDLGRMSSMVNDMLFLAHADGGQHARMGEPQDLRQLMSELLEYHEPEASERGLQLRVDGDLTMSVDEPLLQRAVSNLLSNACRYAAPGSVVRVVLGTREMAGMQTHGVPSVAVINEGPEISANALRRLFDRFYRGDASRYRDGMHAGLGLAIVAAIARMHGGGVWATSDARQTEIGIALSP